MTLLDSVDGLPVHLRQLSKPLLRQVRSETSLADALADGPAAGKDPVGRGGRRQRTKLYCSCMGVCIGHRTFVDLVRTFVLIPGRYATHTGEAVPMTLLHVSNVSKV